MGLFGAIVKTVINVGIGLPVAIVKDVVTLGNVSNVQDDYYTTQQLEQIKRETSE